MGAWTKTALWIANIGAVNWAFSRWDFDLVKMLVESWAGVTTSMIVYYIIAICGLVGIFSLIKKK